jgi:hypothetical protein
MQSHNLEAPVPVNRGTANELLNFKRRSYAPISGSVLPFSVFRLARDLDRGVGRVSFGGRSSSPTADPRDHRADCAFRPASKDDLNGHFQLSAISAQRPARDHAFTRIADSPPRRAALCAESVESVQLLKQRIQVHFGSSPGAGAAVSKVESNCRQISKS